MPERVAETTTGSDSGNSSPSAVVELTVSAARTENAALIKLTKTKHNGRFRITSFLQLESRTCLFAVPQARDRERIAQLSFFFLRRSFFAVRAGLALTRGSVLQRRREPRFL